MALAEDLKVYGDLYKYLSAAVDAVPNFPRLFRFSVGEEFLKTATRLPKMIVLANMFKSERAAYLSDFIAEFENCKVIVRLASDKKWLSRKQLSNLMYLEALIGKQITAWKNFTPTKPKAQNGAK